MLKYTTDGLSSYVKLRWGGISLLISIKTNSHQNFTCNKHRDFIAAAKEV